MIAKERYTSTDYLRAEVTHLWPRVWQVAGLSSDLPRPGSYFTFDIAGESILVVRQENGIRAFHNVCLHRGRRLCEAGMGQTKAFHCRYHGWNWRLDGSLAGYADPQSFAGSIPEESSQLTAVACDEWAGFVWINLSPEASPLRDYLGPVAPLIEAYRMQDFALIEDQTLDMPCNWKVCIDAFNEVYHLKTVHPELLGTVDDVNVRTDLLGIHGRLRVPFFVPSPHKRDREEIDGGLRRMLEEAGLDSAEIRGSALEMRAAVQRSIRDRESAGLFDCSALSDEQLTESSHFHIFPNFQLDLYSLNALSLRARPHPTDPGRMLIDQQRFQRVPRGAERPQRPKPQRSRYGDGTLGHVTDQDMFNLARVQRGMQSSGFKGLVLGDQEILIEHLHRTLDTYIAPVASREPSP